MKMQGPRNLGEAYALAKIQEEYLATVERSSTPAYETNRGNWAQSSSQKAYVRSDLKDLTLSRLAQGLPWLCKS